MESKVLGFELVKGCMPMMETSKGSLKSAGNMLMGYFIWREASYSRDPGFVYLKMASGSF